MVLYKANILRIVSTLVCLLLMTACSDRSKVIEITQSDLESALNDLIEITEVTQNKDRYELHEAIENGDVVTTFMEDYNIDALMEFIEDYNNGTKASIRVVGYTMEGDAIITDLTFDGEQFLYFSDCSRDNWGPSYFMEAEFDKLIVQKDERHDGVVEHIYLTSDDKTQIVILCSYDISD